MCGIAGFVDFRGISCETTGAKLGRMLGKLNHRGPDDEGVFISRNAALGMRRLAILDLPAGHQPMRDTTGRYTIVFNGELYNYRQMRTVLEKVGYKFTTSSDTEVVLYSFIEFGERCVEYFNGMFAFVIWDEFSDSLFGARDRIGIKPLYIHCGIGPSIAFASELSALLEAVDIPRKIDLRSLAHYLSFEYMPVPFSAISRVERIAPATRFIFDGRGLRRDRYWSPSFVRSENRPPTSWRDYVVELDKRLQEAVGMEMVADVPIGLMLSGGLDSSTVAYYAAQHAQSNSQPMPICFTASFAESSFDESRFAIETANTLGLPLEILNISEADLVDGATAVLSELDEPFADPSMVPTYLLARFAAKHVKVVLGGDGGDELFAGYPTYKAHRAIEIYERILPRFIRSRVLPWFIEKLPSSDRYISIDFKLKRFLAGRGLPAEVRHHRWLGSFSPREQKLLLHPARHLEELDPYEPARLMFNDNDARTLPNKILYCDMNLYLEGGILTKLDRATMRSSLEARVPLLNHRVVSYVLEIPFEFKLRLLKSKFLLKMLMHRRLSDRIVHRPKHGFGFPLSRLLRGPLRDLADRVLERSKIEEQGIFRAKEVRKFIDYHCSGKHDLGRPIWTLMAFQAWYDRIIADVPWGKR